MIFLHFFHYRGTEMEWELNSQNRIIFPFNLTFFPYMLLAHGKVIAKSMYQSLGVTLNRVITGILSGRVLYWQGCPIHYRMLRVLWPHAQNANSAFQLMANTNTLHIFRCTLWSRLRITGLLISVINTVFLCMQWLSKLHRKDV